MKRVDDRALSTARGLQRNAAAFSLSSSHRHDLGRYLSELRQRVGQQIFVADYVRPKVGPGERNGINLRKPVVDILQRVLSWTVLVLLQHCGADGPDPVVVPLHIMKNTTKRVRRMAYCREDDGSALDQPSDKALAREEMLVRNKTRRKVVCASRSPFQRQFDHLNSVGVTQQPAQPGIPRFRARQNCDFSLEGSTGKRFNIICDFRKRGAGRKLSTNSFTTRTTMENVAVQPEVS